jgi:hypothetical protein
MKIWQDFKKTWENQNANLLLIARYRTKNLTVKQQVHIKVKDLKMRVFKRENLQFKSTTCESVQLYEFRAVLVR